MHDPDIDRGLPGSKKRAEHCDKMIQFVKNHLSAGAHPEPITPEELQAVKTAVERRLYSIAKCGVKEIKDIFSLPTSSFYDQYRPEVALLQSAGEKLCRLSLTF